MAEKIRCKLCGFSTVRCGITNHFKARHPNEWKEWVDSNIQSLDDMNFIESLGFETKEERLARQTKREK